MTGFNLVFVIVLSGVISSTLTVLVMHAQADVGESCWHAHMDAKRVVVRRYIGTRDDGRHYDEAWSRPFDPADVDSRSAALAEAEDVMAGMRDLDRRLHELRAST